MSNLFTFLSLKSASKFTFAAKRTNANSLQLKICCLHFIFNGGKCLGEIPPSNVTHDIGCRRPAFPGISIHMQEQAVLLTIYNLKIILLGQKIIGIFLLSFFGICYWNGKEHMWGFPTHIVSFLCSSSLSSHSTRFP